MMGTLFVALALLQGADAPERFVQDRFVIGFWVEPPADEHMAKRYKEIADANFTLVLGGFGANTAETTKRQLALCKKYHLKALAWSVSKPDGKQPKGQAFWQSALFGKTSAIPGEELPEGPACWGYLLRDEPNAADFPALRQRVDEVRTARPGRLAYINLFPDYASPKQLGTETYDEYVRRFLDEVDVDVLSMDYYPIFKPDLDMRDGYCGNLETFRRESMRKGIPFWNFFNVMPYGPHTDPTEAQLRWQAFTSVAYGAKGVLYFCYWTPIGDEFPKGGAILRTDGTRTRHYDQAKRLNGVLKSFGPTLMKLSSTGVLRIAPGGDVVATIAGSPLKALGKSEVDPALDLLVGTFKHADGRRAVMINNYSVTYSSWPTVEFDAPLEKVVEIDPKTGREIALYDESPAIPGMQLSLDSGEGRLFLLP